MPAYIEWLSSSERIGIVRAGAACSQYPDPYEFSCVVADNGRTAHLSGGTGVFENVRSDVMLALWDEGIRVVIWERIRADGSTHNVRIELDRHVERMQRDAR